MPASPSSARRSPRRRLPPGAGRPPAAVAGTSEEVVVEVLGPVSVRGLSRPLSRAGSLELAVYLAMTPRPVPTEGWATALWPDRLVAPASLHSTASDLRRALGCDSSGTERLARRRGSLGPLTSVRTDWQRFKELVATGERGGFEAALRLVRGAPFEGLHQSDWTVLQGHRAEIEEAVVIAAEEAAGAALEAGDGPAAAGAARQGLRACPFDERLHRVLMVAADAVGNRAGIRRILADLVALLEETTAAGDHRPVAERAADLVHPATLALYRALAPSSSAVLPGHSVAHLVVAANAPRADGRVTARHAK